MSDPPKDADPNSWKNTIDLSVRTDVGMRRAINQDSMSVLVAESQSMWEQFGHVFIVADGMGAHAAGELASKLAVELIPHHYLKLKEQAPAESLHKAIAEANAEIFRRGQANIEFRSMGTTCSLLALLPEGAVAAHVGDSRVYQLRGEQLYQLTFDHSLVWEMQAAGEVTDETAQSGVIPKNVITRSLGPNASVQIDLEGPFPTKVGDRFLLCSDGLSGQVTDEEIGALLKILSPDLATRLFIDLSNLRGGPDNITAIAVEVVDERITTAKQGTIAVRRGGRKSFSPALGIVSAVCAIVAVLLFFAGQGPLAIVAGVLGFIALVVGIVQVAWPKAGQQVASERYGNGPYRSYPAKATLAFFEHLAGTMQSLRDAAEERNWKIDWPKFEERFAKAKAKANDKDFAGAIEIQSGIITDLVAQIKRQRGNDASDSSIDL